MKSDSSEGLLSAHLELLCDSVHYLGDAGLLGGGGGGALFFQRKENSSHAAWQEWPYVSI